MSANPNSDLALAGDYVLGHLSDAEKLEFEQRLALDAGLRAVVRDTRERLLELDLTAPPATLSSGLWEKISSKLNAAETADTVVPLRPRAHKAGFWSGFATAGIAAALLVAIASPLLWRTLGPSQPKVIVVLVDQAAKPGAIIEAYADDSVRVVPLENFTVPSGRVIQVWTLPDAQTGPVSLGLLPGAGEAKLVGPHLPAPKTDQLYEFTLEPEGGSPTGRPTGPILVKGFAKTPPAASY